MQSYTLATVAAVAALAAAQSSSPAPTSTGNAATSTMALPFFVPFATQSIGASVISGDAQSSVYAVTCLDASGCPQPPTATYTVGTSTLDFKASGLGWNCPISSAQVTCSLSAGTESNSNTYALTDLVPDVAPTQGIAQAVTITAGLSPSSTSGGSGMASATGSMSSSMSSSMSGSMSGSMSSAKSSARTSSMASSMTSSASASASTGSNSAEHLVAGSGILGAAALLVGAIVA